MSIQGHFPQFFEHALMVKQLVRVADAAPGPAAGLYGTLAEVGDEFVTVVLNVAGEDPVVSTLPRVFIERPSEFLD